MKYILQLSLWALCLSLCLSTALSAAEDKQPEHDTAVEMQKMHKQIELLQQQMTALIQTVAEMKLEKQADNNADATFFDDEDIGESARNKKLSAIKLPENPSDQDVIAYLKKISAATKGQNTFMDSNKQVKMIRRLGTERVPLILEYMDRAGHSFSIHIQYALPRMVTRKQLPLLLPKLAAHPQLVTLMIDNDWHNLPESRQPLLDAMQEIDGWGAAMIGRAIADWKDPKTYPLLLDTLRATDGGKAQLAEVLSALPNIELKPVLDELWPTAKKAHKWERYSFAKVVVGYGNTEALGMIIQHFASGEAQRYQTQQYRKLLRTHLDQPLIPANLLKWFNENKKTIIFDETTKKYIIGDPDSGDKESLF